MDEARREKFSLTCCDPPFTGRGLTLRALAVPAAVVGDGGPRPSGCTDRDAHRVRRGDTARWAGALWHASRGATGGWLSGRRAPGVASSTAPHRGGRGPLTPRVLASWTFTAAPDV